ncbi:hypothetical protein AMTR_s00012p00225740 [Amborella trichopoda]|uniref:AP-3 complex subunit beta n=2 Tax=Amborella trichopoda TaxID=13333 RepID=W1PIR1_AMBTC|nr:hypothetical protein AMTR_s00012p00225740 [Amborella trichopoda]
MFPQFGATAAGFSKASTMVFRIGSDAHLYDDPEDVSIAPLLDSKFDTEKSEALKRLLALIAQGCDVSNFFPQVVKNVASQSLEVKKLVYVYLLHYAEKRPNEALLSINCFQKDLSDLNPLVRAWALRAMSGIRLHDVAPLVLAAVNKCARDPSPYVRKCAASALPKIHDLQLEENYGALAELVGILLNDSSPGVVGAAAAAFNSVSPNNLSLIGRSFKRLCETLPDVEEWGQIVLIGILLRYVVARHGLSKGSILLPCNCNESTLSDKGSGGYGVTDNDSSFMQHNEAYESELMTALCRCYIEGQDEYLSRLNSPNKDDTNTSGLIFTSYENNDVKLLLQCTSPLLWSQNSAVVLVAAGTHWIMAPKDDLRKIVKPLLFLLRSSHSSRYVVLSNILVFTKAIPSLFASHFEDFFMCYSDSYEIKALKIDILSLIATESSISFIFQEFQDYIKDPDRRFVADTLAAIGVCAQRLPSVASTCLEGLLAVIRQESSVNCGDDKETEAYVLTQAIISIKTIIRRNPADYEKVLVHLIRSLDSIKVPAARAVIVWMLGEYSSVGDTISHIVPTVLKYLSSSFPSEQLETKQQIINSAAKVVLSVQGEDLLACKKVLMYVLELAKCDLNCDVRDRARFIKTLLLPHLTHHSAEVRETFSEPDGGWRSKLVEHIFCRKRKPMSHAPKNDRFYLPGSLSQIVMHTAPGYEPLPKPCSFVDSDFETSKLTDQKNLRDRKTTNNLMDKRDPDSLSGSSDEESAYSYESEHSSSNTHESGSTESARNSKGSGSSTTSATKDSSDEAVLDPLIHLSDTEVGKNKSKENAENDSTSTVFRVDMSELMPSKGLESWLDQQPSLSGTSSFERVAGIQRSACITLVDVDAKPDVHILLDSVSGSGLSVEYAFSTEISRVSPLLVCVEATFKNNSTKPLAKIAVRDEDTTEDLQIGTLEAEALERSMVPYELPKVISTKVIACLDPGQEERVTLHVHFHHHLLPLKLAIVCDGKRYPIKLRPNIGYFVKPLPLDLKTFTDKESQLPGMFEYMRSCTFRGHIEGMQSEEGQSVRNKDMILTVAHRIASTILGNSNISLVSVTIPVFSADNTSKAYDDVSGLCLRFSGEILSSSLPCLITISVEGRFSQPLNAVAKVNCEETVFGLNLLNRIVALLS